MKVSLDITAVKENERLKKTDEVAVEHLLKIYVNKKRFLSITCSPENLEYLVFGLLFSDGLIKDKSEVRSLNVKNGCCYAEVKEDRSLSHHQRIRSSGCGNAFFTPPKMEKVSAPFFTVSPETILNLTKDLEKISQTYHSTGGVHSAALADQERIVLFSEDIGRHNAVDKVIGEALVKGINPADKIFLTSGRISSEIVSKIARANGSVIVSKSAPTNWAVKLARFYQMTLIGFARGKRFNLYTHPERVLFLSPSPGGRGEGRGNDD